MTIDQALERVGGELDVIIGRETARFEASSIPQLTSVADLDALLSFHDQHWAAWREATLEWLRHDLATCWPHKARL